MKNSFFAIFHITAAIDEKSCEIFLKNDKIQYDIVLWGN